MKTHTFHVNGMHCNSCVLLTESELQEVSYVNGVKCSLHTRKVEVTGNFGDKHPEVIARELSEVLLKHGYSLSVDEQVKKINWADFKIAIPIAIGFGILFFLLQKLGLVNLVGGGKVTYGTAFFVGIIASVSTCMAVVGGLVLSMSATFAKEAVQAQRSPQARRGDPGSTSSLRSVDYRASKIKPQLLFHLGRIVSFFLLGGLIGAIGAAFTLSIGVSLFLNLLIGIVMVILGINLLDVFHFAKKLQPSMPKFLSKHALGVSKLNHTLTPLLVGVATFFLPCGFTQSMQLYTLTTSGFLAGGLTMLSFALGTLPVLTLISFSSFSIKNSAKSGIFFKTAGLIVIMFAVFNLINNFVSVGFIEPIFNF